MVHSATVAFAIELEQEDDGRSIAEIPELPGVMAYGATEQGAIAARARSSARRCWRASPGGRG